MKLWGLAVAAAVLLAGCGGGGGGSGELSCEAAGCVETVIPCGADHTAIGAELAWTGSEVVLSYTNRALFTNGEARSTYMYTLDKDMNLLAPDPKEIDGFSVSTVVTGGGLAWAFAAGGSSFIVKYAIDVPAYSTTDLPVSTAFNDTQSPQVSMAANEDGTGFMVVWTQAGGLRLWFGSPGVNASAGNVITGGSGVCRPRLCRSGQDYVMFYCSQVTSPTFSSGLSWGKLSGVDVMNPKTISASKIPFVVDMACGSQGFGLVWDDTTLHTPTFAALDLQGNLLKTVEITDDREGMTTPTVATDGQEYLMVWSNWIPTGGKLTAARFDLQGNEKSREVIAEAGEMIRYPRLLRVDDGYVLAWEQGEDKAQKLHVAYLPD